MKQYNGTFKRIKSHAGFTLIELLIVIALMAIISIPVSASLIFGVKVFNSETAVDTVFQDQLSAFTEIKESLHLNPYQVKVISNEGVTELQVGNQNDTKRTYYLTTGKLMRRIGSQAPQMLCDHVTSFDLTYKETEKTAELTELRIKLTAVVNNREHILESDFSLRRY